ncbi:hypothetical protein HT031_006428 [Scenedesmus sp. PABB004]|nr:hypothetical protein HT031_006428 [Scenedesmus sp. PABB004]
MGVRQDAQLAAAAASPPRQRGAARAGAAAASARAARQQPGGARRRRAPRAAAALLALALAAAALAGWHRAVWGGAGRGPRARARPLWWHAPVYSGSGYGSEAIFFVEALLGAGARALRPEDLWLTHSGDRIIERAVRSLTPRTRALLQRQEHGALLRSLPAAALDRPAIVVCHSFPDCWLLPKDQGGMRVPGCPCPPPEASELVTYRIGRTMFESDGLPAHLVEHCNAMDEVWVPTEFNRRTFAAAGVAPEKLFVVPQGIDVAAFDPTAVSPLTLRDQPGAQLVTGAPAPDGGQRPFGAGARAGAGRGRRAGAPAPHLTTRPPARPLRSLPEHIQGKARRVERRRTRPPARAAAANAPPPPFPPQWEARKGWDVLLGAYLREFAQDEAVELHIVTHAFAGHGREVREAPRRAQRAARAARAARRRAAAGASAAAELGRHRRAPRARPRALQDFGEQVLRWLELELGVPARGAAALPRVYIHAGHVDDATLPRLYASADAVVLPTRGEGWGRPHMEALAMARPLIATNWSGPTAYLSEATGYPLAVEGLVPAEQAAAGTAAGAQEEANPYFTGQRWAEPSQAHLRELMRRVVARPGEAAARGAAARRHVLRHFTPEVLARAVLAQLARIDAKLGRSRPLPPRAAAASQRALCLAQPELCSQGAAGMAEAARRAATAFSSYRATDPAALSVAAGGLTADEAIAHARAAVRAGGAPTDGVVLS